jgi:hypothetical protein
MAAVNKPCAYTNCFLQPTCARGLFPESSLQNTTALITRNPQKFTIVDYITHHPARILGTHTLLECGGDAYVLDNGKQVLELGARFPTIRHYATTFRPEQLGITTEILLLASHRMAPTDEGSFILRLIAHENGKPVAASDDLPSPEKGMMSPWVLRGSEWEIVKALSALTPILGSACNGSKALTPDFTGRASISVHIDTRKSSQHVTLDVRSEDREDGFWRGVSLRDLSTRRQILKKLLSLGFVQD